MNNETKILVTNIVMVICSIAFGVYIVRSLFHSSDDITHIQKEVYDVATTTVSISQEEVDCKKQGGEFVMSYDEITQYDHGIPAVTHPIYHLICETRAIGSKVLSSHTISVGN